MAASREAIMQALFALVAGSASFVTASRRLKIWSDVPASEKPALFMYQKNDEYKGSERHLPPTVTMNVDLYIYTAPGLDSGIIPASLLNPLIDAAEAVLRPGPGAGGRQTLGGLVSHCYIDGNILKEPGDLDGDGVAVIPVKILATV
jgi:hypothetical protein